MPDSAPLRDTVTAADERGDEGGRQGRVGALRLIMAALKEREIEARGAGKIVSRADELALLAKMVKSRQESRGDLRRAPAAPSSQSRRTRRSPSSTNSCPSRWTSRK